MYYDVHIEYVAYIGGKRKLICQDIRCLSYAEFIDSLSNLDCPPIKVEMIVKHF